ncbi:MAG: 3'-5' exonuclease [Thermoleophilia bacterium]
MTNQISNLVIIDIETSGVNPFRHDPLAIGLVPLTEGVSPLVVYIRPETIKWSEEAKENFAKFETEWNTNALKPVDACTKIERYLSHVSNQGSVTTIGHNIGFDVAFLRKIAFLAGKDEISFMSHRVLDTHTMLYLLFLKGEIPSSALNSDGAFKFFGINIPDERRHTALGDALATRELVLKLLDLLQIPSVQTSLAET